MTKDLEAGDCSGCASGGLKKVHDYWIRPDDGLNQPERYRDVSPERSIYLVDLFKRAGVTKTMRILELGPNVGRNLAHLWENGYRCLSGIEISKDAVDLMRRTYPQLKDIELMNAPIEDVAKILPTRAYDVIFSMAVQQHIHPESEWVFKELARACHMMITIEDEYLSGPLHFPRNYRNVYEAHWMKQILCESDRDIPGLGNHFKTRVLTHRT